MAGNQTPHSLAGSSGVPPKAMDPRVVNLDAIKQLGDLYHPSGIGPPPLGQEVKTRRGAGNYPDPSQEAFPCRTPSSEGPEAIRMPQRRVAIRPTRGTPMGSPELPGTASRAKPSRRGSLAL